MITVAKILLYNPDGKILILRRSSTHPRFAHHLDFPGGEVEPNESLHDAAIRELFEETQITIPEISIEKLFEKMNNGIKHVLLMTRIDKPVTVLLSWEHSEYLWLRPDELLGEPLPQGADKFYEDVINYLQKRSQE